MRIELVLGRSKTSNQLLLVLRSGAIRPQFIHLILFRCCTEAVESLLRRESVLRGDIIGIQGVHENVPPFVADNLIRGQRGAIPAQDLSASLGNADGFDATKTSFNLAQIALRRFRQPITHREGTQRAPRREALIKSRPLVRESTTLLVELGAAGVKWPCVAFSTECRILE